MSKIKSLSEKSKYKCENQIPKDFIINNGNLYFLKPNKDNEEYQKIYMSKIIIVSSKVYSCSNNNYFYEISIVNNDFKILKSELASGAEIGQKSSIIKFLSNRLGIIINEINYRYFVKYLSEFINLNDIKIKNAVDTLGWHQGKFAPYSQNLTFDYTTDKNNVLENIVDNMKPNGDKEKWKELINSYSSKDFDFIMGVSFSAPLMKMLGRRTFQFLAYGESNNCKTFACHCGLSVFIKPSIAKMGKLDTRNTILEKAYIFQNIPILIDDCLNKGNEKTTIHLYDLPNEKNRGRLNRESQLTKEKTWRTTVLVTSESRITESHSLEGEYNRTLEVKAKYADDIKKVRKDYDFLENNYALVGEDYINYILSLGKDYLVNKLDGIEKLLYTKNENNLNDHITSVAISILGIYLYKKLLFQIDNLEYCINVGNFILNKLPRKNDIDIHKKALSAMYDYYEINKNNFVIDGKKPENGKIFGAVRNGSIFFIAPLLKEYLEKLNFNFEMVKERLINLEFIEYKQAKISGDNGKRYVIPLNNPLSENENSLQSIPLLVRNNFMYTLSKMLDIKDLNTLKNNITLLFAGYDIAEIENLIDKKINQIKLNRGDTLNKIIEKNEAKTSNDKNVDVGINNYDVVMDISKVNLNMIHPTKTVKKLYFDKNKLVLPECKAIENTNMIKSFYESLKLSPNMYFEQVKTILSNNHVKSV